MLSFSANLSLLFTEVDFIDRFARAAKAGFRGVECQFPYDFPSGQLAEQLQRHRLVQVLHNLPAGDWMNGERGIACLPDRVGEFQDGVGRAIEYATALGCRKVNCLAGIAPAGIPHWRLRETFVRNLRFAAPELTKAGIRLLIEPLNTRDTPEFFLQTTKQALDIIEEVASENLFLQLDIYHVSIMEGDVLDVIHRSLHRTAHIQIADSPGRHEPGTGTIDFPLVFATLETMRYGGWIGCEYVPLTATDTSLTWLRHLLPRRSPTLP